MIKVGVVGAGKMGLSHLAILGAHPMVEVAGVCDSLGYLLDVLHKYTGVAKFTDATRLMDSGIDAVLIATPSASHTDLVRAAVERGIHVFCEKPLTLAGTDSASLAEAASNANLVTQVGYHNRFVGTFAETKRLLDAGAVGPVAHIRAEAQGPVVLRARGSTWRSNRSAGGGALYDYAAHPLDLLGWYLGEPTSVSGVSMGQVFSQATEDEVYGTLTYERGTSAQLSVNWSDESERKMSTRMTVWGREGKITADRQELRVYLRNEAAVLEGYRTGWNERNTTSLTPPVWYYLRGEEYSAQLDHFVRNVDAVLQGGAAHSTLNDFTSAAATDRVIERFARPEAPIASSLAGAPAAKPRRWGRAKAGAA